MFVEKAKEGDPSIKLRLMKKRGFGYRIADDESRHDFLKMCCIRRITRVDLQTVLDLHG